MMSYSVREHFGLHLQYSSYSGEVANVTETKHVLNLLKDIVFLTLIGILGVFWHPRGMHQSFS